MDIKDSEAVPPVDVKMPPVMSEKGRRKIDFMRAMVAKTSDELMSENHKLEEAHDLIHEQGESLELILNLRMNGLSNEAIGAILDKVEKLPPEEVARVRSGRPGEVSLPIILEIPKEYPRR